MTGATPSEALEELESVKKECIEEYLKLGNKMSLPLKHRKYSGEIMLRMPPSLHENLVKIAELEGVSLNQYMVSALSKSVGRDKAIQKVKKPVARKTVHSLI